MVINGGQHAAFGLRRKVAVPVNREERTGRDTDFFPAPGHASELVDRRVFQHGTKGHGIPVRRGKDAVAQRPRVLKDGQPAVQLPLCRGPQVAVPPQDA